MSASAATLPRATASRPNALQVLFYLALAAALALFVVAAASTPAFLTTDNLRSVLAQSAFVGVFAVATALLMLSGTLFSLSISVTGAVCATSFLALLPQGTELAILLTVLIGAGTFAIQGALVGFLGANPIIVSIAAGGLQQGIFLWWTGGATIVPPVGVTDYQWLNSLVDLPVIGQLPLAVFILFGLVVVLEVVLRRTRFGRELQLVGENRHAARAAGLPTGRIILVAFIIAGACVGLVGVELGAFNASGSLLVGSTFTYDAIAAAVVGGIAITGGKGRVWQALAGAIFIQAVTGILLLRGYSQGSQILVKGLIVAATVLLMWLNSARRRP